MVLYILFRILMPLYASVVILFNNAKHKFQKNMQAYFGKCRMLRTGFVFDEPLRTPAYSIKFHMQAYRSGHNEAVLKTVCLTGTGVRIPQPAPIKMVYSLWVDLFLLPQSEALESALRANSRGEGFAFERKPSGSLLTSGGAKNLRQRRIPLFQATAISLF